MARRHPDWLKVRIGTGDTYAHIKTMLRDANLHTICEEAKCPNIAECFGSGTAVFLILGDVCTRHCAYCSVRHGTPRPLAPRESEEVAASVQKLGLSYVVITSVTRDDLPDGGATVFADTIHAIRRINPNCAIEVLIPDFHGNASSVATVVNAKPEVVNHNIEVVQALFPSIRPGGDYTRSLTLLKLVKTYNPRLTTKSGLMVGLGETEDQIQQTFRDLRAAHVDFLTIGQYLQPTKQHEPIHRYYTPAEFDNLRAQALAEGFRHVESGPLVRSSYHASTAFMTAHPPEHRANREGYIQ